MKSSCYIIGTGSLTEKCLNKLLENQFEILGVVTNNSSIIAICQEQGINYYSSIKALLATDIKPFEILFSIINYAHVPDELIEKAELAINYHDGPLPRYAGVHATSWALSEKRDMHGITWHEMTMEYDTGSILKQKIFIIDPDEDTTFTLNVKCFEEALELFDGLLSDIKNKTFKRTSQKLNLRTYYKRHQKLLGNGLIDCANQFAEDVEHLVRVLDFGDHHEYTNRFASPKLLFGREIVFPRKALLCSDKTDGIDAGKILGVEQGGLRVTTKSLDIVFQDIRNADGVLLTDAQLQMFVNQNIVTFTQEQIENFTKLSEELSSHESFWESRLRQISPINVPCLHSAQHHVAENDCNKLETQIVSLETILAYFHQVNFGEPFTFWFNHNKPIATVDTILQTTVSCLLPLNFTLKSDYQLNDITSELLNAISLAKRHKTYLKDIMVRYPRLSDMPAIKKQVVIELLNELDREYQPQQEALITIVVDSEQRCQIFVNAAAIKEDDEFRYFIENMPSQLFVLEQQLQQQKSLKDVTILSERDQQQIALWNDTKAEYPEHETIHSMFEAQVERTPNAIAVQFETGETVTYQDLNERANQFARYLQQFNVTGTFVALYMPRSINMLVSILGVLKTGAAYVPMSIDYPSKRLMFMLQETEASVLITEEGLTKNLEGFVGEIICFNRIKAAINEYSHDNVDLLIQSDSTAVCIYTSGSTGKPKGVMLRHKGIVNCLMQVSNVLNFSEKDIILASSTYIFDVSMTEFFMPLFYGAQILMISDETREDSHKLVDLLIRKPVTVLQAVPTVLEMLLNAGWLNHDSIDFCTIISMGEPLTKSLVNKLLLKNVALYNLFGPSETSIYVTLTPIKTSAEISIGQVMKNVTAYVMNSDLKLLPPMIPGELCIGGGVALAKGYLHCAEQDKSFITIQHDNGSQERLYRTGDSVVQLPDGRFKGLGRIDKQVKLHGYRIELEEIQYYLSKYPGIKQAIVLPKPSDFGTMQIVAYIVPNLQQQEKIQVGELREYLGQFLPLYMIPTHFVELTYFPLLPSGKINQQVLLARVDYMFDASDSTPNTEIEQILQINVAQILSLNVNQVGIDNDLFKLGIDSVSCFHIKQQLILNHPQLSFITSSDFYRYKTIRRLGEYCQQYNAVLQASSSNFVHNERDRTKNNSFMLTPIQHWFFELELSKPHHWNQSVLLRLSNEADDKKIQQALEYVIQQHDIFKYQFSEVEERKYQAMLRETAPSVKWDELNISSNANEPNDDLAVVKMHTIAKFIENKINFEQGSLAQATLVRMNKDKYLIISIHHLIIDGVSWTILLRDLFKYYYQLKQNMVINIQETSGVSYAAWSAALCIRAQSDLVRKEIPFWINQLPNKVQTIPTHFMRESNSSTDTGSQIIAYDLSERASLFQQIAAHKGATLYQLLLSSVLQSLHKVTRWDELFIELESHGRDSGITPGADLSNTVGWFTALYPLRFNVTGAKTSDDYLQLAKNTLNQIPHSGIGFGLLRYLSNDLSIRQQLTPGNNMLISFNYWGQFNSTGDEDFQFEALDLVSSPKNKPLHALDFNIIIIQGRLHFFCHYDTSIFSQSFANLLIEDCCQTLNSLLKNKQRSQTSLATYSSLFAKHTPLQQDQQNRITEKNFPLLPVQQGMLYHGLQIEGQQSYLVQSTFKLKNVNVESLQKAWQALLNRHEALRSEFHWCTDTQQYQQVVKDKVELPWEYHDFSAMEVGQLLSELIEQDRNTAFDFKQAPLMRINLVRLDNNYQLVWTYHHILFDGWSMSLLLDELYKLYNAYCNSIDPDLPSAYSQQLYTQYSLEKYQTQNKIDSLYWKEYLSNVNPSQLFDFKTAELMTSQDNHFSTEMFDLDDDLREGLCNYAKERGVTLNILMQVVWGYLLSQYNRTNDIVMGTVVSDRGSNLDHALDIVGVMVKTLPVRLCYPQGQLISDSLKNASERFSQLLNHDSLSLTDIARLSTLSAEQLFQTLFVFGTHQLERLPQRHKMGLTIGYADLFNPTHYPLTLLVITDKRQLSFKVTRDCCKVDHELVLNLMKQYRHLLSQVIMLSPSQSLAELSIYSSSNESAFFVGNNTSYQELPVHTFIDQQALKHPDLVAVEDLNYRLSYKELTEKANQFAHYLLKLTKRLNSNEKYSPLRVTICMDPGVALMIAVLGTLKAGGFYIPIDPSYPAARTKRIFQNSKSDVLIVSTELRQKITPELGLNSDFNIFTMPDTIEETTTFLKNYSNESPDISVSIDDPCYCVYTSGSTGQPKGVLVPHRTIVNLIIWQNTDCLPAEEGMQKNIAMTSPFGFDQFENQTFYALMNGYSLFLVSAAMRLDLPELLQCFITKKINQAYIPTSMLSYFAETALANQLHLPELYDLIVAGEGLFTNQAIRDFFEQNPKCRLKNYYGPSEAHVVSAYTIPSMANWSQQSVRVPIGQAIANTILKIVDQHGNTLAKNMTGELLIAGDCVGLGYLDAPHLTEERFIIDRDGKRYYKTGDLVRLEGMELVYLGRIDNQLKIRGCRVEPGEIENALAMHHEISQVVVLPKMGENNRLISLIAFYIPVDGCNPDENILRHFLLQSLPKYMLPQIFIKMKEFSLTGNGKKDREVLLMEYEKFINNHQSDNTISSPRTNTQRTIADLWADLLAHVCPRQKFLLDDDFFTLGGHSILAIQLLMLINQKLDIKINMNELLSNSTLAGLSMLIDQKQSFVDTSVLLSYGEPIFLIHPIGGTIFWYKSLGPYLKRKISICGISDPGLDKNKMLNCQFGSITDMATCYIEMIKQRKPFGPYVVGGASSGGIVALEIARLLQERGEKVTAVLLFDSWAINPPLIHDEKKFKAVMKNQMLQQCTDLKYFDMNFWLNLQWSRAKLLARHTIQSEINHRVILFRANENYPAFNLAPDPNNYWKPYFAKSGRLIRIEVPGNHETMFSRQHIQELAKQLNDFISRDYKSIDEIQKSKNEADAKLRAYLMKLKNLGFSDVTMNESISNVMSERRADDSLSLSSSDGLKVN